MASKDSSNVRVGVIGLGMGRLHANTVISNPGAELVAVCDLDPRRLAEFAPAIGPDNCFTNYMEMLRLNRPDLAIVALPNFLHARTTIDCLEAGCATLCEKPIAMNVEEGVKMRDAAERSGNMLGINLSFRFTPTARALKALANEGVLGQPYHAYTRWTRFDGMPGFGGWFGRKEMSGGGPLIDLGVHRIDLAMWLMGSPQPRTVSGVAHHHIGVPRAQAAGKTFDVEDFASGFVRFENGATLAFEVSWAGPQEELGDIMFTRVMGTAGALMESQTKDGRRASYSFIVGEQPVVGEVRPAPIVRDKPASSTDEMIECVHTGRQFPATAEEAIRIQQILDSLYESARQGCEVDIAQL